MILKRPKRLYEFDQIYCVECRRKLKETEFYTCDKCDLIKEI